ncbi:MAG: right-handed parallel beta-helix repeat-containing protein [Verrucomicrobiales bacterium]
MSFSLKSLVSFLALGSSLCALELYVSPGTHPDGSGTREAPFPSLEAVRDHLRQARTEGRLPGDQATRVKLLPGVYRLNQSFKLEQQDSGKATAPIIYQADQAGTVELRGGHQLPAAQFQPIRDEATLQRLPEAARAHVRVIDLAGLLPDKLPSFPEAYRNRPPAPWLYVDGEAMTLARWPNADAPEGGWTGFTKVIDKGLAHPDSEDPAKQKARPGVFVFGDPRPTRWNLAEGVWLKGYWTHDWYDEVIKIASYDPAQKAITLAKPHSYGLMNGTWGDKKRRFFAENLLEELDQAGEWYLDRSQRQLYYYPKKNLADSQIILATQSHSLIEAHHASHLAFEGLHLRYNHGPGLTARQSSHLRIENCHFSHLAGTAISLHGEQLQALGNELSQLGQGGITVNGGDRKSLTPSKNLVAGNEIHHYARFQRTYAPGIAMYGCGGTVRQNLIHHAPHIGITYSGNEHLIELNEIHHVVQETSDAGAIYTGRDWTSRGNLLRHNYLHHLGTEGGTNNHAMGIYLDDCDSGDTLEGNIFHRAGRAILIGGGRDNPVKNNLFIDCAIGIHLDSRGMSWKQWNNPEYPSWMLEKKAQALDYQSPPWSERYPSLARIMEDEPRLPLYNDMTGNIFIHTDQDVCQFDTRVIGLLPRLKLAGNFIVPKPDKELKLHKRLAEHPGFTIATEAPSSLPALGFPGADKGDFTIAPDSWLRQQKADFPSIPIDQIGLPRKAP